MKEGYIKVSNKFKLIITLGAPKSGLSLLNHFFEALSLSVFKSLNDYYDERQYEKNEMPICNNSYLTDDIGNKIINHSNMECISSWLKKEIISNVKNHKNNNMIVISNPELNYLLPLIISIASDLQIDLHFVYLSRHPWEIAMSNRSQLDFEKTHILWLKHHKNFLQLCSFYNSTKIEFNQLYDESLFVLYKLSSELGIKCFTKELLEFYHILNQNICLEKRQFYSSDISEEDSQLYSVFIQLYQQNLNSEVFNNANISLKFANDLSTTGESNQAMYYYLKSFNLLMGMLESNGKIQNSIKKKNLLQDDLYWVKALEQWENINKIVTRNLRKARLKSADELRNKHKLDEASADIKKVLANEPNNVQALSRIALIANQKKDWNLAIRNLSRVLEIQGKLTRANVFRQLGYAYRNLHDYESAEKILYEGLQLYEKELMLLNELAEISMFKGDYPEAVTRWQGILNIYEKDLPTKILLRISRAFFQIDAFDEAEKYLNYAYDKSPSDQKVLLEQQNLFYKRAYITWRMHYELKVKSWKEKEIANLENNLCLALHYSNNLIPQLYGKQFDKKLMEMITTYLILADIQMKQNNHLAAAASVNHMLNLFKEKLDNSIVDLIGNYHYDELSSIMKAKIIDKVESIGVSNMSSSWWLALYDILKWKGLFAGGLVARCKAVKQAYHEADSNDLSPDYIRKAYLAAIEQSDFDIARRHLESYKAVKPNDDETIKLEAYYYLNTGDCDSFVKEWSKIIRIGNNNFYKAIQGKSVAIVGPASNGKELNSEISNFDVVVFFNYIESCQAIKDIKTRKQIKIAYYNDLVLRRQVQLENTIYQPDLDYYVFPTLRYKELAVDLSQGIAKQIISNDLLFHKTAQGVPRAIFDILLNNPLKLKIFNSNLYLSENIYSSDYIVRGTIDSKDHDGFNALRFMHDPVSQLSFMRNMWKAGVIEVDSSCEKVLRMSDNQYMNELEILAEM